MMIDKDIRQKLTLRIQKKYRTPDSMLRGARKLRAWLWMNQPKGAEGREHTQWITYMQMYTLMIRMLAQHKLSEDDIHMYKSSDKLEPYEQAFIVAYPDKYKCLT